MTRLTKRLSTVPAQRRLVRSIAALDQTPGGIQQLQLGALDAIEQTAQLGHPSSPQMAAFWRAVHDLASAVHADLRKETAHERQSR